MDVKETNPTPSDGVITTGAPLNAEANSSPSRESEPSGISGLPSPLKAVTGTAVALCVAASLVHVLMVFLFVAPPNQISQRYNTQIGAWIYPLFEQNWRLFAPDPESAIPQIEVRTARIGTAHPAQVPQVSGWLDLTAVDDATVRHDFFPATRRRTCCAVPGPPTSNRTARTTSRIRKEL